jgi:hypothetical protein
MSLRDLLRLPLVLVGVAVDRAIPRGVDPHLRHFLALRHLTDNLNAPEPFGGCPDEIPDREPEGYDVALNDWWNDAWWDKDPKRITLKELLAAQRAADIEKVAIILDDWADDTYHDETFEDLAARIVDALEGGQ